MVCNDTLVQTQLLFIMAETVSMLPLLSFKGLLGIDIVFFFCLFIDTCLFISPRGFTSRGGDVTVYVFNINQPSLPTPFYSVFVSISLSYGPFNYISFHKFSLQLSVWPLCPSSLISALLVLYESLLQP